MCIRDSIGVERVEDEAGLSAVVDVLGRVQVVGVSADARGPALLERAPRRVVEHVARLAMATAHLADGLLGEDGLQSAADGSQGAYVSGSADAEAITRAERCG